MDQGEIREGTREMLAPGNVNERLEEAVSERPLVKHLLDLKIVLRAVLIAAVLCVICLLFSPLLAAVVLVLAFFGSWFGFAYRDYDRRRPTKSADDDEEDEDDDEG